MEGPYQHPVFFECPPLDPEQKKKLKHYFHIRQKSGGGDCGSLTNIRDNIHCIAFKDQKAQQRVLQKSEHELMLGSSSLVFTVRGSLEPPSSASSPTHPVSSSLDFKGSSQSQQQVVCSSLPPCGEDYELQLDTYLLKYLKECPRAKKELDLELAAVSCSAQLHPDEGRVVIRASNPAKTPGGCGARQWKAEVDQLFQRLKQRYICHFEVDPLKIKALLQSSSLGQLTDELKVYSQVGMAVVVGEESQVNAKLKDLEKSHVKGQGSSVNKKQTRTCRLGEAKLRLLWGDIKHSLGQDFPELKVKQGDVGQVILEGSVEEVFKAGQLISKKEKLLLERTLSDFSLRLLSFLMNAYRASGVLCAFLGVDGKVEIELENTELRIFSLSSKKLDETERALREKFKEVKVDVSNCFALISDLTQKLESKAKLMNQGSSMVKFVIASGDRVCIFGHTKAVDELHEAVKEFILDQSVIESTVTLPFPELVQDLPEFLQLHGFDYKGVTFHPLPSSSHAMVSLEGPSNRVTQVISTLDLLLRSIFRDTVTIDLPGAVGYFQSQCGREALLNVGASHKSLIQFQDQHQSATNKFALGAESGNQGKAVASYHLQGGLQVLVCLGDITTQHADALVNAANEDLDNCGGVASALSHAGGPEVQKECSALVKQIGKIPTGDVVVTTGGNLNCKKLLHAVGPRKGKVGGRETVLLERVVRSALKLADDMEFKSIAMPCISSGVFGVPVRVCSDAIVTAIKQFGSQGGLSLNTVILIDNKAEVVRSMQEACDRILQGVSTTDSPTGGLGFLGGAAAPNTVEETTSGTAGDNVQVAVVQGTIETQQVDALVSPMHGHDPLSSRVGNVLSDVVGSPMITEFHKEARWPTLPGEAVLIEGLLAAPSRAIFFLTLLPWDKNPQGRAIQVLRQGISRILDSCENKRFESVALPVIGIGTVLRFPHNVVARTLLQEIQAFEQKRTRRTRFLVRIVIHPSDKDSTKAFQSAQETVHLRGFTNDSNTHQASFYRYVSSTQTEVIAMLGGVKLEMVSGDIINEKTDVIVNTTDFSTNQSGVSKAILTAAGPNVQAELSQVGIPPGWMYITGPGQLHCREIIHAGFKCDAQVFRKHCKKILKYCETKGYQSAAFPAINTGAGGMDSDKACKAMLDGLAAAILDLTPNVFSLIRIIIFQEQVFCAFRSELENRLGQVDPSGITWTVPGKLKKFKQHRFSRSSTSSTSQDVKFTSWTSLPAVIRVITLSPDAVRYIKSDLEKSLQVCLVEREVDVKDFSRLGSMELEEVQTKIRILGIQLKRGQRINSASNLASTDSSSTGNPARAEARDRSGSRGEIYILKGLREDVLSVVELIHKALQEALHQDIQDQQEVLLALTVQWSVQDRDGVWQDLSQHDNCILEDAYSMKKVFTDVAAPGDGAQLMVNLTTKEATDRQTGQTYRVKRTEIDNMELPSHWELMNEDEHFRKIQLNPDFREYQEVAQGFLKTAKNYTIHKIERVQNSFAWHGYSVRRQHILAKNGAAELREKLLYHGTSEGAAILIEKDRFDRAHAGMHAANHGKGVYFAVNAEYSARCFSPPDTSGLKRVLVARVLTGRYTVGVKSMVAPPPRAADPTDCYDSLVDNQQKPTMFVIFHDNQAYPEYLITFK
ncbi:protein mono-ADP-ribosyltransferase PARP14-like isoform X2 [Thalassophryne amazonica]|uniref:protein mono-ADP-ribosyltransferase PARP14-like isoform X2 n=1 Tax=Thalassophryne amazonica TaxID=390379 RepID=UPI001471B1AE|nr:protein mono-ADP-ribosyltransferase PARP14-like isoform X2 [Thalassophryne amazonica]